MKIVKDVDELLEVIGFKEGDTINIMTPQFERTYELESGIIPQDERELKALIEGCPKEFLKQMGVQVWDTYEQSKKDKEATHLKEDEIHYLFPAEWYDFIPNGFEVVGLHGEKYPFVKGESDNDIRFGCLAYGFIRNF